MPNQSHEEKITKGTPKKPYVLDEMMEEEDKKPSYYPVRRRKKPKFTDKYTRATFYVENHVLDVVNEDAEGEKGEKTAIINKALKQYYGID